VGLRWGRLTPLMSITHSCDRPTRTEGCGEARKVNIFCQQSCVIIHWVDMKTTTVERITSIQTLVLEGLKMRGMSEPTRN